ncbi:hypothetical protein ACLM5J_19490 [Nocardioides sp. Bht2]|uniref:hypothetical protein n=1 Tax=Nocardioides sp. Bht2 TaxID=3392297 RepID=UPI0039B4097B
MSWIALWLLGAGLVDLAHSARPSRHLPSALGAFGTLAVALLAGLVTGADLAMLVALCAAVAGWGYLVTYSFGRQQAWAALAGYASMALLLVLLAQQAGPVGGPFADWVRSTPLPILDERDPQQVLLLLAVLVAQMSTGNVIVRLVLAATGTVNPSKGPGAANTLKGGRLLGPMERIFIVGLGVAGHATAASIVIAAKGLLRWPELQAHRDATSGPSIDDVTEYFLVGSFVSWLWALGGLVLLA